MQYIIALLAIIIIYMMVTKKPLAAFSNWHHHFDNFKFSSQEFYERVQKAISEREIPNIGFSRVEFFESGMLSTKREYLRVTRNEYVFDICAAPFGTGFFVSWWLGKKDGDIIARIPIINTLVGKNPDYKSYFQMDTESMFRSGVHAGVLAALDEITASKGIRMTELERIPKDMTRK